MLSVALLAFIDLSMCSVADRVENGVTSLADSVNEIFSFTHDRLPDRTTEPACSSDDLESMADLELPPGNVAVAPSGRVFFTYFPMARSKQKVMELVDGKPVPFPSEAAQKDLKNVLSVKTDSKGNVWALDYGDDLGKGAKLVAWDANGKEIYRHAFGKEAGLGSLLNDFVIDEEKGTVYIADQHLTGQMIDPLGLIGKPGILVHDLNTGKTRKVLAGHESVKDGGKTVFVEGKKSPMQTFGIDSIAMSPDGQWLYYKTLDGGDLWKVRTSELGSGTPKPVKVTQTTMSDGAMMDPQGRLYLTDVEHSAIVRVEKDGTTTTLYKDPKKLPWPDSFSMAPDGSIWMNPSSLHEVAFRPQWRIKQKGPYHIYRFKPCK